MTQQSQLERLLRTLRRSGTHRQDGCPEDIQFAAYFDGALDAAQQNRLSGHVADCDYCLQRLGVLGRARDIEIGPDVPLALRFRVDGMEKSRSAQSRSFAWAMAAVLVLAVGLVVLTTVEPRGSAQPAERGTPDLSLVRSALPAGIDTPLRIESVGDALRWSPVPDRLYYEVRIVTDEGDLVWRERSMSAEWSPPAELKLDAGREYFIRVDAFLSEANSLPSDFIPFRSDPGG